MGLYNDLGNFHTRDYDTAAVCRRGHVETEHLEDRETTLPTRCKECGAQILTKCPSCQSPIQGRMSNIYGAGWKQPEFCTNCGTPMPWASRQARMYQLENILDEQPDLSEADRLTIHEQITALTKADLSEEQQAKHWRIIKQVSPTIVDAGRSIIVTVTTELIQKQLGLK